MSLGLLIPKKKNSALLMGQQLLQGVQRTILMTRGELRQTSIRTLLCRMAILAVQMCQTEATRWRLWAVRYIKVR